MHRKMRHKNIYPTKKAAMTYRDYINQSTFEQIWRHLQRLYHEGTAIKATYRHLYESVKALPFTASDEKIVFERDRLGDIMAIGTLDPQEDLIDRKVIISDEISAGVSEIAAHLLYWSSMYGFQTLAQYEAEQKEWYDMMTSGPSFDEDGMVKYIFLDFDGVLNTEQYQAESAVSGKETKDKYGPLFDPDAIVRLKRLCHETGAKNIVIISSWRFVHDNEVLHDMWKSRDMPGEDISVMSAEIPDNDRGSGIKEFCLGKYAPFVILDGKDIYPAEQKPYLIHVDPVKGLTDMDVDNAIEILNRFDSYPKSYFISEYLKKRKEWRRQGEIESPSLTRKRIRFWQDTIVKDWTDGWESILCILKKKLEYNIGKWKCCPYRSDWREVVRRMELCCRLLQIASETDMEKGKGVYVNETNAERYGDWEQRQYLYSTNLRKEKAFSILWRYIDFHMQNWCY